MFSRLLKFRRTVVNCQKLSHTDIKVPDFSDDMLPNVSNPNVPAQYSEDYRKCLPYTMSAFLFTSSLYATKAHIIAMVEFMAPSSDVLALSKIEINLNQILEDNHATFKWRGKPLFVWHRTDAAVKAVRDVPLDILRDPERDEDRVQDRNWLVCLGVCTHLGCVPISHQGDFGGYYCPCHGSHFDISGRTRKGPAPTNLEVPPYSITGTTLIVG